MDQATTPPCTIVIFGAAGDLTQRLLMPSIYNLAAAGVLHESTQIIGADHNDRDAAGWQHEIGAALHLFSTQSGAEFQATIDEKIWASLARRMDYVRFDFKQDADFRTLAQRFEASSNVVFYFAVSPHFFEPIAVGLARAGLFEEKDGAFRRMVVEKPFGHDLDSARKLYAALRDVAAESQIYCIDHFLGKEAVQGIAPLRFANSTMEPFFHRAHVASVQITAAETVGVEERGAFYETTGALRDMVPNHLFSLLTLITMEQPAQLDAQSMRDAKVAVLREIRPLTPDDAVRGQYERGTCEGKSVPGYREEPNVAPDSHTETFVALRVFVDTERWRDVPFYLRTGKRMRQHATTIALVMRPSSGPIGELSSDPQMFAFGIDPIRGFVQRFSAKRPGVAFGLGPASVTFHYTDAFHEPSNVGYELLLDGVLRGNALHFQRADMIENEWKALQGVLEGWSQTSSDVPGYAAGSGGPDAANALLAQDGNQWFEIASLDTLGEKTASP